MGDCQYSFSLTTFSPSGKLVQIEYTLTTVGSGQTSMGNKGAENSDFDTKYWSCLQEPIPVTQLVRETAAVLQEFTQSGFEGQISSKNIEIGIIGTDKVFRILTPTEIDDYLQEVE